MILKLSKTNFKQTQKILLKFSVMNFKDFFLCLCCFQLLLPLLWCPCTQWSVALDSTAETPVKPWSPLQAKVSVSWSHDPHCRQRSVLAEAMIPIAGKGQCLKKPWSQWQAKVSVWWSHDAHSRQMSVSGEAMIPIAGKCQCQVKPWSP